MLAELLNLISSCDMVFILRVLSLIHEDNVTDPSQPWQNTCLWGVILFPFISGFSFVLTIKILLIIIMIIKSYFQLEHLMSVLLMACLLLAML